MNTKLIFTNLFSFLIKNEYTFIIKSDILSTFLVVGFIQTICPLNLIE